MHHGTVSAAVRPIMREGLVPGKGDPKEYAEALARGDHFARSVYLSDTDEGARSYAETVAESRYDYPVVLTIRVPEDRINELLPDEEHEGDEGLSGYLRFEGTIPPEWIVRVEEQDDDGNWKEIPLRKAFDPNQPREPKGSPEGGRWTDGDGERVLTHEDNLVYWFEADDYTDAQKEGLREYTSGGERAAYYDGLLSAVEASGLTDKQILYSGFEDFGRLADLTPGAQYVPMRFISASTDQLVAEAFANGAVGGVLTIDAEAGTNAAQPHLVEGIDLSSLTTGDEDPMSPGGSHYLREVILHPKQVFTVVRVDKENKVVHLKARKELF